MELSLDCEAKIELIPLTIMDARDIFALWSDKAAVEMTNWPYLPTFDDCVARLERSLDYYANPAHFGFNAIRGVDLGFVGVAGADVVDAKPGTYDVWYFLKREMWGRGLAKQALHRLLEIMRDSGRADVATATVVTTNIASWRVLESQGFKRGEIMPGAHTKHGLNLDLFSYSRQL